MRLLLTTMDCIVPSSPVGSRSALYCKKLRRDCDAQSSTRRGEHDGEVDGVVATSVVVEPVTVAVSEVADVEIDASVPEGAAEDRVVDDSIVVAVNVVDGDTIDVVVVDGSEVVVLVVGRIEVDVLAVDCVEVDIPMVD